MTEHDASDDTELHLKKRARRRLVGASALVLLAVIILPMVMDHEPRPPLQDVQVRIPSQDAPGLAAKMLQRKEAATPLPAPNKPEPAPVPSPAPAAVVAANPEPNVEAKPEAKVEPKVDAKAEPKVEAKAEAKPEPKAVPAKAAVEGAAQWEIQLGAYKEGGNAKLLLKKLKELKLPAYSENFDSPQGPRVRVRAGPFATREAAEKAHSRLKIIGVDGPVAQK